MNSVSKSVNSNVVILAGGRSRRMGRDKLEMPLGGQTMLESAVSRFSEVFEHVYISVAEAGKYQIAGVSEIVDIKPGSGPLSGLHAALTCLPGDGVFLLAGDLPYSCPRAAKRITELCGACEISVVRLPDGRLEPLFGYYRKTLLQRCEEAISSGDFRMSEIILAAYTRYVDPLELGGPWNDKIIMNINNPEDYIKAALEF